MWFITDPNRVKRPSDPDRNYFMVGKELVEEYDSSKEEEEEENEVE
jgi:hypothetical protein